jgi:hypothetical protein
VEVVIGVEGGGVVFKFIVGDVFFENGVGFLKFDKQPQ